MIARGTAPNAGMRNLFLLYGLHVIESLGRTPALVITDSDKPNTNDKPQNTTMKTSFIKAMQHRYEQAKVGYAMLWLLGVPLPILLIIYLVRGH